jgi:hypothetical protein
VYDWVSSPGKWQLCEHNPTSRRHSKAGTTINIYEHASPRSQDEATWKIEELVTLIPVELQ